MTLRMWLLCLVCVAVPAWGSDGKDGGAPGAAEKDVLLELGWEVGGNDKAWKEACAFLPGGELWRFSGSSSGSLWSLRSSGLELFALRHEGRTVLYFGQEGHEEFGGGVYVEESERWQVRCQPGRIDIVTPATQVSLQAGAEELKVDPRFSRILRPGSRELEDPAVQSLQEVFEAIASSMRLDSPSGLGEAFLRARLLNIERLLAASKLAQARDSLETLPSGPGLPELSSWAADLKRRLEDPHSKPPLMATGARRVGAIMSLPKALHEEDNPILFWRDTQLCVRQEASKPPRMRCVKAETGSWGKEEPYRSPYGKGSHVSFEELGKTSDYMIGVSSSDAEDSFNDYGNWYEPVVVARGKGGRLKVVSSKNPLLDDREEKFDPTTLPVSLLAGGGRYYFSEPDELRSLEVEGLAWKFVVPVSGGEVRCAVPPRVSPDGRWAACPARQAGAAGTPDAKAPPRFDLLLFGLTPRHGEEAPRLPGALPSGARQESGR